MIPTPRLFVAALCLALLVAAFGGSIARAQGAYSDTKLEAFVKAAIQVESLMREYDPQIQAAETPQRADNLRRQAKVKMQDAIDQSPGISLDEYARIVMATQSDKALNDRVDTIYRATKGQ